MQSTPAGKEKLMGRTHKLLHQLSSSHNRVTPDKIKLRKIDSADADEDNVDTHRGLIAI